MRKTSKEEEATFMGSNPSQTRRRFLTSAAATLGAAASLPARAQDLPDTVELERDVTTSVRRNISSFRSLEWQPYFSSLRNGAVLVDLTSRAVHYWSEDETIYKLYPSSVPLSEDLTRRGRTSRARAD